MRRYLFRVIFCAFAAVVVCPEFILPKAFGLAESTGPDGSNAQAVHALGEKGAGVNIGLISADNTRTTHEAFFGKNPDGTPTGSTHAFAYDATGDGVRSTNHDTWVAGVAVSRGGFSYPDDIGVAPGADIYSARVVNDAGGISTAYIIDALDELVTVEDCRVIVTTIALPATFATPNGDSTWTKIYEHYAWEYDVVFANPSGKDYTNPTVWGDGYNGITTGGLRVTDPDVYRRVGYNSNLGLTVDGRNKPDVVAPSQNQTIPNGSSDTSWTTWGTSDGATSFSTPHTAGVAALLLGLADESTSEPDDNQNEVIKAVIVNSTFPNVNERDNTSTTGQTYNADRGYGRLDALMAYQTLAADRIDTSTTVTAAKGWAFENIGENSTHTYTISCEKRDRLLVTVTWDREVSKVGPNYTAESPLLNIDMEVLDPESSTVFSETDTINNLQKCDILLTKTGYYRVEITNTHSTKSRDYGLAFELLAPIPADFTPVDYIVDHSDLAVLVEDWLQTGSDMEADLVPDNEVNTEDFVDFADYWLETDPAYYQ